MLLYLSEYKCHEIVTNIYIRERKREQYILMYTQRLNFLVILQRQIIRSLVTERETHFSLI